MISPETSAKSFRKHTADFVVQKGEVAGCARIVRRRLAQYPLSTASLRVHCMDFASWLKLASWRHKAMTQITEPGNLGTSERPRGSVDRAHLLLAALALADYGFSIFPLVPNGTLPAFANWRDEATKRQDQVKNWWREIPDANIGVATDHLLVIDVDPIRDGTTTFSNLLANQNHDLPGTLVSRTPNLGTHIIYWMPHSLVAYGGFDKLGAGVNIVSNGGYIVGAGSSIDGLTYAWQSPYAPDEHDFVQAPHWLVDRCDGRSVSLNQT